MPAPEPIPDLLKAVNEASGKAFALWITFLTVGTYLAIAIGTTTDRQLLLGGPVKLPLLGVDLPLFAFYNFAPPLFVVLHLYVLMQIYLLARLLRLFDDDLRAADMIEQDRRRMRGQLDKFVFTQFLIGSPSNWIIRLFLWIIVWMSFLIGPIVLIIGFQLQFLPYHSLEITHVHRVTLLLDLVLLLLLWPAISRSSVWPVRRAWRGVVVSLVAVTHLAVTAIIAVALLMFSISIATIPGEPTIGWAWAGPFEGSLAGLADLLRRRVVPVGLVHRNLDLTGERLVELDEAKLATLSRSVSLRGRDLRHAILAYTDLRKADLSWAFLEDADMFGADLSGADLTNAYLTHAELIDVKLNAANLTSSHLIGASLFGARLIYANLHAAEMSNANLSNADLSHADLYAADLAAANLTRTDLRDSLLRFVRLTAAKLSEAKNISQQQLDSTCGGDAATTLPKGMKIKTCDNELYEAFRDASAMPGERDVER
jgi:uncharacterized protein YjbI with pentapeptide repeats